VAALFLVALAAAVTNLIIGNIPGAIFALASGLAAAAVGTVYAVTDMFNAQTKSAEILTGEAGDPIGFADGRWPAAVSEQFVNRPGDRTDWVARQ
jgi:hypothetical protein